MTEVVNNHEQKISDIAKSYKTRANAVKAMSGFSNIRYMIMINEAGRYQPIVLFQSTEWPMQYAHAGFMVVG